MPSPALITPCTLNVLPSKLAANVPNNIGRSPPFCSSVSFLIFALIYFTSNPDSSNYLTIFVISSILSFEIVNAVVCEAKSEEWPDP